MLFWFFVTLQILTGVVAGEAAIRKTPEGTLVLQKLSNAGFFFLHWRAFANQKKELLELQKLFGTVAIIFSIMFFILGKATANTPFALLPGLFIFLWLAMKFGTNFRKSVRDQLNISAIMVIAPWAIYLMDNLTGFQLHQIRTLAIPFSPLGILKLPDLLITVVLSIIDLAGGLFMAISSTIAFSIFPLFFLFLMTASSKISRKALSVSPKSAYNIAALYFFLIGPILIALESKGVI